jgi:hypothetical protein
VVERALYGLSLDIAFGCRSDSFDDIRTCHIGHDRRYDPASALPSLQRKKVTARRSTAAGKSTELRAQE